MSAPRLLPRDGTRPRLDLRGRLARLRDRLFLITQCSVGGALAWVLAHDVLGHPMPFFAPVTVIVALGLTYGQRIRRVVELAVGVAIGVLVGDVAVHLLGTGPLQLALVVFCAMSLAVLAGAGGLMMIQAGVQSMIISTLVAEPGYAFSRWLDALVGGAVALLAATITPATPVRRPRQQAAAVIAELAGVLRDAATAGRRRDRERAEAALARARGSELLLGRLREATAEGIAVIRASPFRRRQGDSVLAIAQITEPLDRATRNLRVLARRVAVALEEGEALPPAYLGAVDDLAQVMDEMVRELSERRVPQNVRPALVLLGEQLVAPDREGTGVTSLSGEVVRAQLRSMVVDLLILTGWSLEEVRAHLPPHGGDDLDL